METKKLTRFSLEDWQANPKRKVVTDDGRDVRIICTDRENSDTPIVALIREKENASGKPYEDPYTFFANGRFLRGKEDSVDLFFASDKKVGWMNLYKRDFGLVQGDLVCDSEEAAKKIAAGDEDYITTIRVEWEEQ